MTVDSRGSAARGARFIHAVHRQVGTTEVTDLLATARSPPLYRSVAWVYWNSRVFLAVYSDADMHAWLYTVFRKHTHLYCLLYVLIYRNIALNIPSEW